MHVIVLIVDEDHKYSVISGMYVMTVIPDIMNVVFNVMMNIE